MPILEIEGRKVEVEDAFLSLSPEQQQAEVEGIAKQLGVGQAAPESQQSKDLRSELSGITQQFNGSETDGAIRNIDSFVRGAADTMSLGFGDEISALGDATVDAMRGNDGQYDRRLRQQRIEQEIRDQNDPYASTGGQIAGALAGGLGLAKAGLSPATNMIDSGAKLWKVAAASGVEGATLGALQGFGSGEGLADRIEQAKSGAKWGLGIGAISPYAVAGISKAVGKAVTPLAAPAERLKAADYLASEGVPLTAGQKTGSKGLRYAESELGGDRAANLMEQQGEAFTDAAMRRAGGSGRATSDSMQALATRLGQGFDDISARNTLRVDQGIVADMNRAATEYAKVLPVEQKAIFTALGDDIAARFRQGGGSMSGKDYQTIRSRLTRMAKNYRQKDGEFADAIRGLRNALDSGMERSIVPGDRGLWGELRRKYGNMKVLEAAANGGGEDAGVGIISPARLRMAASSGNKGGYARGQGDFAELAKAGQAAMTPLPNSGTAARSAVRNLNVAMPTVIGTAVGGGYGAQQGGLEGALAGALAGFVAPKAIGAALMSKTGQRYLANQLMRNGAITPEKRGLINAVLTFGGGSTAGRLPAP